MDQGRIKTFLDKEVLKNIPPMQEDSRRSGLGSRWNGEEIERISSLSSLHSVHFHFPIFAYCTLLSVWPTFNTVCPSAMLVSTGDCLMKQFFWSLKAETFLSLTFCNSLPGNVPAFIVWVLSPQVSVLI